jgi:hypothetical protein
MQDSSIFYPSNVTWLFKLLLNLKWIIIKFWFNNNFKNHVIFENCCIVVQFDKWSVFLYVFDFQRKKGLKWCSSTLYCDIGNNKVTNNTGASAFLPSRILALIFAVINVSTTMNIPNQLLQTTVLNVMHGNETDRVSSTSRTIDYVLDRYPHVG